MPNARRFLLLAAVCAAFTAALAAQVSTGPKKGTLVIVGGGAIPLEISERFLALAGGADAPAVVIPTAAGDNQLTPERLQEVKARFARLGFRNVTVLHTRDRRQADSEEFVAPLRSARAVWFPGGRQWRLADAYLNTRTQREIEKVLERGGTVGGTSAGATILGSYMVRGASGTPERPDGDNTIMMAPGHETAFGFLRNTTIDQHVLARRRENDLATVIAAHPGLLGIGIDEGTAIVVSGDTFEVIGKSKVTIVDGKEHGGKSYYLLSPGQKFNLRKRAVL